MYHEESNPLTKEADCQKNTECGKSCDYFTILDLQKKADKLCKKVSPVWLCRREGEKKRVHLAGLGDVGAATLTGLVFAGGDVIKSLGIYDLNRLQMKRLEIELNQIADPFCEKCIPPVFMLGEEELFQCEVFIFCVSRHVPEIGQEQGDVRMAQFASNRSIIEWYVKKACREGYKGLFLIMSDPVELLCKAALLACEGEETPLQPWQIQGCGLGVMNARAMYFARREEMFRDYLPEGRVFGSHGEELVVANSIQEKKYDEAVSIQLTEMTIRSNLEVRGLGFKPYIAPAFSSGVCTILNIMRGQWNYSSNYLGGIYFGGKNRTTETGVEWEVLPLPERLFRRLKHSYQNLEKKL